MAHVQSTRPGEHAGTPGTGREEGPGKKQHNEEPDIRYEDDIPSDGPDSQGEAEIRNVPARPELSPTPDHLKN
jgi:hypothetical protein